MPAAACRPRAHAVTQCFGQVYLTTRAHIGKRITRIIEDQPCWITLVRRLDPASGAFVDARVLLPQQLHTAHNAGVMCARHKAMRSGARGGEGGDADEAKEVEHLHVFGGQAAHIV